MTERSLSYEPQASAEHWTVESVLKTAGRWTGRWTVESVLKTAVCWTGRWTVESVLATAGHSGPSSADAAFDLTLKQWRLF